MGNWSAQQEVKKEIKERDKTRKENITKYYLDLSKLTFVALVLGGITPLYTNTGNNINWAVIVGVVVSTVAFASIGNRILK